MCLLGVSELPALHCGLFTASVYCYVSSDHFDGKLFINWIAPATCSFIMAKKTQCARATEETKRGPKNDYFRLLAVSGPVKASEAIVIKT